MAKAAQPYVTPVAGADAYINLSASGVVCAGPCNLLQVFCASSSGGTLKLWDNASAGSGSVIVNTFTLIGGTPYPIPIRALNGVYATITGTADITVSYS